MTALKFYVNTNYAVQSQSYFNNDDARVLSSNGAPASQILAWRQDPNTVQAYSNATTSDGNSSRFNSTLPYDLNLNVEALYNEFWTQYQPLLNDQYIRNPSFYDKVFGQFLTDYCTNYLFFDRTSIQGVINSRVNASTLNLTNYNRYANAVSTTSSVNITSWNQYLETVGQLNNPGPFGAVPTKNPYTIWQTNAQKLLNGCLRIAFGNSTYSATNPPTTSQVTTQQTYLTNQLTSLQAATPRNNTAVAQYQQQLAACTTVSAAQTDLASATTAAGTAITPYELSSSFMNRCSNPVMWVVFLMMEMINTMQKTLEARGNLTLTQNLIANAINDSAATYTQNAANVPYSTSTGQQAFNQTVVSAWQGLASQAGLNATNAASSTKYLAQDISNSSNALSQITNDITTLLQTSNAARAAILQIQ